MIDPQYPKLSVRKQCDLLALHRSSLYYKPAPHNDSELLNQIVEIHLACPQYGYRRIHAQLQRNGVSVNRKRVQRLMKGANICALYPKPKTTLKGKNHEVFPYLLAGQKITRPHQVWQVDITYLKVPQGFLYLTALIDVFSRYVVSWRLSNSLSQDACLSCLEDGIWRHGPPEIINSDQGSQFTGEGWLGLCQANKIKISMSHVRGSTDNAYIERFWRTLKYEGFYLDLPESVFELKDKVAKFINWYNQVRLHSSIGYNTPQEVLKMADHLAYGNMDNVSTFSTFPQSPTTQTTSLFSNFG